MRKLILLPLAFTFWVAFACPLAAQDNPCTQRSFLVTVVDREGHPVPGLTAANFRGKFRGKPVQIDSAIYDTGPRRMVIVLDASGSMTQLSPKSNMWDLARELAIDAGRRNASRFSMALVIFASRVFETVDFDKGYVEFAKRLSALRKEKEIGPKKENKTALFDALMHALHLLTPTRSGDIVYVITDGGDNSSVQNFKEIEDLLNTRDVRVYCVIPVVGLADRSRTPEEALGVDRLQRLAISTGGNKLTLYPISGLTDYFWRTDMEKAAVLETAARLHEQMRFAYRLKLQLPLEPDKARGWDLDMVDSQGKGRRDLTVHYPHKLLPCSRITPAPTSQSAPK